MKIIFLGPPGIGKGTQAKILAERKQILHLSTGDMLRIAIEKKNDVGLLAALYMNKGRLVPDEIVLDLVSQRLEKKDISNGFIFDGFPRTLNQANGLKSLLSKFNYKIDHVIAINGKNKVLIETNKDQIYRRSKQAFYWVYNLKTKKLDKVFKEKIEDFFIQSCKKEGFFQAM